jgi:hypothetical protein
MNCVLFGGFLGRAPYCAARISRSVPSGVPSRSPTKVLIRPVRRFPRFTVAPGVPSIPVVPTCNLLTAYRLGRGCSPLASCSTVPCRDASRRKQAPHGSGRVFRERSFQRNAFPSSIPGFFLERSLATGLEATLILCLGGREVLLALGLEPASSGEKTAKEGTNAVNHGVVTLRGSRYWPCWCQ